MLEGLAAAGAERLQLLLDLLEVTVLEPAVGEQNGVVGVADGAQHGRDHGARLLVG